MDIFHAVPGTKLKLGKRGTNKTRTWRFDIRQWQEDYPTGQVYVLHQRPDLSAPTPVSYTEVGDGYIDWTVGSGDVAAVGKGLCEVVMVVTGGERAKTMTFETEIEDSICPVGDDPPLDVDPPSPEQGWVEDVLDAATDIWTAKAAAEDAQAAAELAQGKAEDAQEAAETAQGKAEDAQDAAEDAQDAAEDEALKAEGYAVGKQAGEDVGSFSPYYHNSAKYYSGQASAAATSADTDASTATTKASAAATSALVSEGHATGTQNGTGVSSDSPYYHNSSKYYSEQAASSATDASDSASSASTNAGTATTKAAAAAASALVAEGYSNGTQNGSYSPTYGPISASRFAEVAGSYAASAITNALKAEGYAVGKQSDTDVGSSSPYYHNNAKYYSDQAAASATSASESASTASTDAGTATTKATAAAASALVAEGYADGKQNGVDVSSGSGYYHNNAKYYSEQAAAAASALSGIIDDTAGDGDTTKVWSADKLTEEFSEQSEEIENIKTNAPQDETGEDLLAKLLAETLLTESVLTVAGAIIDALPSDETANDIKDALSLTADRLSAIYDIWLAEKEAS